MPIAPKTCVYLAAHVGGRGHAEAWGRSLQNEHLILPHDNLCDGIIKYAYVRGASILWASSGSVLIHAGRRPTSSTGPPGVRRKITSSCLGRPASTTNAML